MAKKKHFDVLNPFNGLFSGNLVNYAQGHVAKDFLEQFWKIENVVNHNDVKNCHFRGQNTIYGPLNPFNGLFGANLVPYLRRHIAKDILEQFWRIKMSSVWGVTSWWRKKLSFFAILKAKTQTQDPWTTLMLFFVLIWYPIPNGALLRTYGNSSEK